MEINEYTLRETFYGFIQIFSRDARPSCRDRSDATPNWQKSIGTNQGTEKSCKRYMPWIRRPRNVAFLHFKLLAISSNLSNISKMRFQTFVSPFFCKIYKYITDSVGKSLESSNAVKETYLFRQKIQFYSLLHHLTWKDDCLLNIFHKTKVYR